MQQDEPLDVEAVVNELEKKLDRLKVLYEQYFMGIEKREPLIPLKDVVRLMRALDQVQIRNTGVRYKLRTLIQRFNVYRTYWNRTLRAINNGTYHRDVARVSRKLAEQGVNLPTTGKLRSVAELEQALQQAFSKPEREAKAAAAEPAPPAAAPLPAAAEPALPAAAPLPVSPATAAPPPPRPPAPPRAQASSSALEDLPEREIQSIYRRFIKAKQLCGEDISSVRYESLAKSIRQQLPKIRQQNPGKDVEFQVVLRNGRAIIRAKAN